MNELYNKEKYAQEIIAWELKHGKKAMSDEVIKQMMNCCLFKKHVEKRVFLGAGGRQFQ